MYTPRSSGGCTLSIFLHKNHPIKNETAKNDIPQMKICRVEAAVSGLNSLEVMEARIMQGVVTISRRSTKYLVASEGRTLSLFKKNPTAMIRNIAEILEIIIVIATL